MSSIVIENAAILTLDEQDRFIERGCISIEGSRISSLEKTKAERVIDGSRFPNLRQAELAVQRFANFVEQAPAAHAA